jgi:hypothetical protein
MSTAARLGGCRHLSSTYRSVSTPTRALPPGSGAERRGAGPRTRCARPGHPGRRAAQPRTPTSTPAAAAAANREPGVGVPQSPRLPPPGGGAGAGSSGNLEVGKLSGLGLLTAAASIERTPPEYRSRRPRPGGVRGAAPQKLGRHARQYLGALARETPAVQSSARQVGARCSLSSLPPFALPGPNPEAPRAPGLSADPPHAPGVGAAPVATCNAEPPAVARAPG